MEDLKDFSLGEEGRTPARNKLYSLDIFEIKNRKI